MSVQGLEHETDVYKINNLPLFFSLRPGLGRKRITAIIIIIIIFSGGEPEKKETPCNYVYEVIEYR